jgi:chromosome segregation ATPase
MSAPADSSHPKPPFPTRHPSTPTLALTRRANRQSSSGNEEVEKFARQMEAAFSERERQIAEGEARLADRARDLDEMEALLRARESLIAATRLRDSKSRMEITPREAAALNQLKEELERQEASLREARAAIREREAFLEESENRLFAKVQEQQEKETELEQREEELVARAIHSGENEPAAVAATNAPAPAYDEFRE